MNNITDIVDKLLKKHGGLRKASRAIGMSAAYLSRLHRGHKVNPSETVLRKLGVRRNVTYTSSK